ncbi:UDP-N-acetylmuramoyl-L-alanyl-D-glutamate--2,6-diaminopimelate ligase [Bacillus sp. FJAT-42376]|uniref:UDP-N-acetylmuramoyl-L-alanyl-D-glutamate--2, 6-diaminopimelate ligase n=1 Tax=Bacillus sp. FJAT-42376 TaxID=2014076 RepID=UPI000F50E7F8|nr:UDP-N-acetylmuramoyl-L-alanyl-D-glutamate--2,6-diaminopimelate ligase [Bacillus sp. FJAT-42376]AZB43542.1 UDP-N-acetylmuramoyl-L-alanyl-D-glutamate--2,6-diaminopimelate ligase [Bacillus sp. FJAT-42376]
MLIQFDSVNEVPINHLFGPLSQRILHLAYDSRQVKKSSVFFSMKGESADGHQYIEEAILNGAAAVYGSSYLHLKSLSAKYPECTFIVVDHVRETMAKFAKRYFQAADEKLKTVGITGTNGKTTVAAYVRSLLTLLGMPAGSIGTTGFWSSTEKLSSQKSTPTTPESADLQYMFQELYHLGDEAVAMEVSSIALDQHRVDQMVFDVAIHTNLSEEHLEYHKTFARYKECKMRLFKQAIHAVINADDEEMGKELSDSFSGKQLTYSLSDDKAADLKGSKLIFSKDGTAFDLTYGGLTYAIKAPIYGDYNVSNVLAAVGACLLLGFEMEQIIGVLPKMESPEGRFQIINGMDGQKVILDYAHTPVALTRLLQEVKKLPHNRLIVMIAGIGIRDFAKMPKMAKVIEHKADEIVVTVDHPGHHDPQAIVDQVMKGFRYPEAAGIHPTLTRKEGVLKSLSLGQSNDIILLTSGCINGAQMVKGKAVPHSDEAIIEEYYSSGRLYRKGKRFPAKKILLKRVKTLTSAGRNNR